jgi:hypothetical protein
VIDFRQRLCCRPAYISPEFKVFLRCVILRYGSSAKIRKPWFLIPLWRV